MGGVSVEISERDVIKLVAEFLDNRKLHLSEVALERETGVINGQFSSDCLFLRQIILDGQWDTAMDFIQPLCAAPEFDSQQFHYVVLKYKFFELLCINQEPGPLQNNEFTVEEVVDCLKELETLVPSKKDYNELCLLLTLPKLSDHQLFRDWNPTRARLECFAALHPLVRPFLPLEKKESMTPFAKNDRLVQLVVKGLFYEACVDLCQNRAIRFPSVTDSRAKLPKVLNGEGHRLSDADLSLLTWLDGVPEEIFSLPFEQKSLELRIVELRRPQLEACWTEQILATPIKPQQFPHAAVPNTGRLNFADKLSRSMIPQYEFGNVLPMNDGQSMQSAGGIAQSMFVDLQYGKNLSRSMAPGSTNGFQLGEDRNVSGRSRDSPLHTGLTVMTQSIDHLFEGPDTRVSAGRMEKTSVDSYESDSDSGIMRQSVYDQLEQIKRKSLQSQNVEEPPASAVPVKMRSKGSMGQSIAPSLPTVLENNRSNEALNSQVLPPDGSNAKLYSEFQKQRQKNQPSVTPTHSPPLNVTYSLMRSGMNQSLNASGGSPVEISYLGQPRSSSTPGRGPIPAEKRPFQGELQESTRRSVQADTGDKHQQLVADVVQQGQEKKSVNFVAVHRLEDSQAIRAVAFHPSGKMYAIGSNSRQLYICHYPDYVKNIRADHITRTPEILLVRPKQHRGSVYSVCFNPGGELLATGSNDKAIRLMSFDASSCKIGTEMELTMHDGTVRDLVFVEDNTSHSSLLISGGAGNCRIHVTDCLTGMSIRALQGHTAPILGLSSWGGCMFASCSQDKTIRFWDLRAADCINMIAPGHKTSNSPVTALTVDSSGRLLTSGHEDASVMLYDMTGSRVIQIYRPHIGEVRTLRYSPGTYYLLSGSYDNKIVITDLRGDLTGPLMHLAVASHEDKIIQVRWHPTDFTFISTSADRKATLWGLPPPSATE